MLRNIVRFIYDRRAFPKWLIAHVLPTPVLLTLRDFKIYVQLDDWAVGARIAVKRSYEHHVTQAIIPYLQPGAVVVDIGANIGYYTLLSAARVGPTGSVLAFEPSARNCMLLEKSVKQNGFSNVIIHCKAVADKNGPVCFTLDDSNGSISQINSAAHATQVEALALDLFLQNEPRIDVIKIDIEGAEGLALHGMKQLLQRHRPIIFSEFSPAALRNISGIAPEDYLNELRNLGYALYVISNQFAVEPRPQTNSEIMLIYAEARSDHLDLKAMPEIG